MTTAAGVTYTYDGDGRRVSKSSGKLYWYGSGGEILAETNSSGTTTAEYVFFAGRRVAMLPAGANAQYYVEDFLGSSRVVTQNNGTVCYDADFAPYGQERPYTNSCTQNVYKFEGKERDTETGNDDFGARYYIWRFGRWLSSDWSAVPAPVPYANLTNPQTLNLYAMVADDPESFADLDGHENGEGGWCGHDTGFLCGGATDEAMFRSGEQTYVNAPFQNQTDRSQAKPPETKPPALVELFRFEEGSEQPLTSHVVPRPKGTKCEEGVICEDHGKKIRVGDYDGERFCDASGCYVWNGGYGKGSWTRIPFDQNVNAGQCGGPGGAMPVCGANQTANYWGPKIDRAAKYGKCVGRGAAIGASGGVAKGAVDEVLTEGGSIPLDAARGFAAGAATASVICAGQ
jgi:RHS repeat-associated protein